MRYGFVIDQRRCIGCHACTVACKEENAVPLGVFRTWVKYVERGTFPHTRRSFAVLRCNHCDRAPCVTIYPTVALYRRPDGTIRGGGAGEVDPIANLSRYHYMKELYLDSATTMCVLSAVPTAPDVNQPLPIAEAATTVRVINDMAKSQRCVMHAFVMPNRGSAGSNQSASGVKPVFLDEELALMMERAKLYRGFLRGWKTYCPWGDVPFASGWFLDDQEMGQPFIDQVRRVSKAVPDVPPVIATHKGFALPMFDQRAASPRDIGSAARQYPDVNIVVYHSGVNGVFSIPGW